MYPKGNERAPIPHLSEGGPDIPAIIQRLNQQHRGLQGADKKLMNVLALNLTPGDRILTVLSKFVPSFMGEPVAPDPVDVMEHTLRSNLHSVLSDLNTLGEIGRQRIERHNQLSEMVSQAKEGEIKAGELGNMIRETASKKAGLPRLPFVEEQMAQILEELPPEVIEQREEKILERMEIILDLTRPVVEMIEQAFIAGTLAVDSLMQNYYLITEVGPGIKALKEAAGDLQKSAISSLQTPELLRTQVNQAARAMEVALEAVEVSRQLEFGSDKRLLVELNARAEEISDKVKQLTAPGQPKQLSNASKP